MQESRLEKSIAKLQNSVLDLSHGQSSFVERQSKFDERQSKFDERQSKFDERQSKFDATLTDFGVVQSKLVVDGISMRESLHQLGIQFEKFRSDLQLILEIVLSNQEILSQYRFLKTKVDDHDHRISAVEHFVRKHPN